MVERFNGRIEEVLQSHHFRSGEELETTLHRYVWLYNQQLPQSALGSKAPLQAMKDWHKLQPELFKKQPYYLTGCDIGCIPLGQDSGDPRGEWGGWFCACHGSQYDTAGRIRKGPAPRNLDLPPYTFVTDTRLRIAPRRTCGHAVSNPRIRACSPTSSDLVPTNGRHTDSSPEPTGPLVR
jgi:hypothetical protein